MDYGEEEALHFGAEYYPPREDCDTEFHLLDLAQSRGGRADGPAAAGEARFVAGRIRQLLDEGYPVQGTDGTLRPCRPEDIVVLMRSPGSRSAGLCPGPGGAGHPLQLRGPPRTFSPPWRWRWSTPCCRLSTIPGRMCR